MSAALPTITTIIPTYRRPELLGRALRSVLRQTYPDFQVCIYDNASGDETAQVVAEVSQGDPRVKYYCHPTNIGAEANFIYGMERIDTPYFSFLSDDDLLLPTFFESTIQALTSHPTAIYAAAKIIQMTDTGSIIQVTVDRWKRAGYFAPPEGFYEMIGKHPSISGILFRRELLDVFGTFDRGMTAADVDLEFRVAARFPIVIVPEPSGIYMSHEASTTVKSQRAFLAHDFPRICDNIGSDERIQPEVRARGLQLLTQYLSAATFRTGIRFVVSGAFDDADVMAATLRTYYGQPQKARTLTAITTVSRRLGIVRTLLATAYRTQNASERRAQAELQERYGAYADYLRS